jgi:hypothetical protein
MFTFQFVANDQTALGDLKTTVFYTNGTVSVTEGYTDANASTIIDTINNRLAQLQSAEDFVTNNTPQAAPTSKPLATVSSTPLPSESAALNS